MNMTFKDARIAHLLGEIRKAEQGIKLEKKTMKPFPQCDPHSLRIISYYEEDIAEWVEEINGLLNKKEQV